MAADSKKDVKEETKRGTNNSKQNGVSEEDVRKESSKVAKQAREAHDKATELMKAAAAAGDPEERQKLMEQALEQQVQSGSLGKTAKYLRSGTFQGMAVGAGLGIAPGASLGTITGTLVGGVSSTALGGLGAGLGAATGWLHGPFWDMSKGAGKGIQKITGNIPGWKATESQKKQLEKMIGQINEQDAPGKDELESWGSEDVSEDQKEVLEKAQSKLPSMPTTESLSKTDNGDDNQEEGEKNQNNGREISKPDSSREEGSTKQRSDTGSDQRRDDNHAKKQQDHDPGSNGAQASSQVSQSQYNDAAVQTEEKGRKKPRKLQVRSENGSSYPAQSTQSRKQPRKIEKRSI